MMDKVQKPSSPECHIPSSEPFKVYRNYRLLLDHAYLSVHIIMFISPGHCCLGNFCPRIVLPHFSYLFLGSRFCDSPFLLDLTDL
jgi:hypothetical protein